MLCDQFAEWEATQGFRSVLPRDQQYAYREFSALVKESPRYILDRAATMMVQNLTLTKASAYLSALDICRLPVPQMWVEFDFKDRSDWLVEASKRNVFEKVDMPIASPPQRMGFFLDEFEKDGIRFLLIQPVWSHFSPNINLCSKCFSIATGGENAASIFETPEKLAKIRSGFSRRMLTGEMPVIKDPKEFEASVRLEARMTPIQSPWLAPTWEMVQSDPVHLKVMEEMADYDLMSEWRFVLSLLSVLNSRNLINYGEIETYERLNKARAKKGKAPLLSHRPIKLNLSKVQKRRILHYFATERRAPTDPQYVHGHFKVRKSGVFWWSPHNRLGDASGRPPRTYNVTASDST